MKLPAVMGTQDSAFRVTLDFGSPGNSWQKQGYDVKNLSKSDECCGRYLHDVFFFPENYMEYIHGNIYHHPPLVPQRLKFDASVGAEWATPQVLNEATLSVDFPEAPVVCGSRMV